MDKARENILRKLQAAVQRQPANTITNTIDRTVIFGKEPLDLNLLFEEQFVALGGKLHRETTLATLPLVVSELIESNQWKGVLCYENALQSIVTTASFSLTESHEKVLQATVSITSCQALIARTGSILVDSSTLSGRRLSIVSPIHIVVAYRHQLVLDMKEAFAQYPTNLPSMVCLISGNSKTADIEKTLVNGAHGPKELHLFLLD